MNATAGAIELAEAKGVDITAIEGTGLNGKVTKADVLAAVEGEPATKEQKGIEALRSGVSVKDVASQQGVSYGTALYWSQKIKQYPDAAKRNVDIHAAPMTRNSGRY